MKFLEVTYKDHVWRVPLKYIADNRAKYYSDDPDTTYEDEFKYCMEDDYQPYDWFQNNMDWEDVSEFAELVEYPSTLKEPHINSEGCEIEIIELDEDI